MRIAVAAALTLFCVCWAAAPPQKITVTGQLTRAMAIGGESTGWSIHLDSETTIDGKPVHDIEVHSQQVRKLEKLANQRVQATGKLSHRQGVETGNRSVLELSSIKVAFNLANSEWLLKDLAGTEAIASAPATLAFEEAGKVSGRASCNRFFGSAQIDGNTIHFGPLGSTRMACAEPAMSQETKYLTALQSAERFEWQGPYLLLYCRDLEKPLRFTRLSRAGR